MSERRHTRVETAIGAILGLGGRRVPCMTGNLSKSGLFAVTAEQVPVDTPIDVELVHGETRIKARGRVAQQHVGGLGIQFVDGDAELEDKIVALLESLLKTAPGERPHQAAGLTVHWQLREATGFWQRRRRKAVTTGLSTDGAGLRSRHSPELGQVLTVYLRGAEGEVSAEAEVVRHTDAGFAVRFLSPSIDFRHTISKLRKGSRPGVPER